METRIYRFSDPGVCVTLSETPIHSFQEADTCIRIAQGRENNLVEKLAYEELKRVAYIQLQEMLSRLRLENGLLIDPLEEQIIIDQYNKPGRLREKFRSQIRDTFFTKIIAKLEPEDEQS